MERTISVMAKGIGCIIILACCLRDVSAAPNPVFPLPTREQRIIQEMHEPSVSLEQLKTLSVDASPHSLIELAQVLALRGSVDGLPLLEDMKQKNKNAPEVLQSIEKAVATLNSPAEPPVANANMADTLLAQVAPLIAFIKNEAPTPNRPLDFYDPRAVSEALLKLGELSDLRSLPSIQAFVSYASPRSDDPIMSDPVVRANKRKLQELYWQLRWKGASLSQKLNDLKQYCDERDGKTPQNGLPDNRLPDGVAAALAQDLSAWPTLIQMLPDGQISLSVKNRIVSVIGRIANSPTAEGRDVKRALRVTLDQGNLEEELKQGLQDVLLQAGEAKAIREKTAQLIEALNKSTDPTQFTPALDYILELGCAGKINVFTLEQRAQLEEAMIPYIKQNNTAAVMGIRYIGGKKSIAPLKELVASLPENTDDPKMSRAAAITSVGFVSRNSQEVDPEALMPLIHQAYTTDPIQRVAAVQGLARAGGETAIPVLVDLAKSEKDSMALRFEVSSIYYTGGPIAVEALKRLVEEARRNQNATLQELCEEGLLRLHRENREEANGVRRLGVMGASPQ